MSTFSSSRMNNRNKTYHYEKSFLHYFLVVLITCVLFCWTNFSIQADEQADIDPMMQAVLDQQTKPEQQEVREMIGSTDIDADQILKDRGITIPEKDINWEELKAENSDVYAWIYIPGTDVDYPILQHPTDNSYYLLHNIDGSEGYPGCIYSELYNTKSFEDYNTILYGHNMLDGSMFTSLHRFKDGSYLADNHYCYVYRPDGDTLVYDLYAAVTWGDEHLFLTYKFEDEEQLLDFMARVYQIRDMGAQYREEVQVSSANHILTLATCENNAPSARYLVIGVLINDPLLNYYEQRLLYEDWE